MTDQPNRSLRTAFLGTVQGRIISALTIIALLIGIVLGCFEAATSYWHYRKMKADAGISEVQERARTQEAPDFTGQAMSRKQGSFKPSSQEQASPDTPWQLIRDPSTRTIIYFAIWGLIFLTIGWGTTRYPLLNAPIGTAAFFALLAFVKYGFAPDVLFNAAFAFVLSLTGRLLGRAIYPIRL
jgi:hypothetical protein